MQGNVTNIPDDICMYELFKDELGTILSVFFAQDYLYQAIPFNIHIPIVEDTYL